MKRLTLAALLLLISPLAFGAGLSDVGVKGGVGLMGWNAGLTYKINDFVGVSGEANFFNYSADRYYKGVQYAADVHFSSQALMLNIYPFAGGFHVTAGLVHNGNSFSLDGIPDQSGNYTFNGTTYSAQQVGTVTAGLTFKSAATYVGLGWGGNGAWGVTFDLGLLRQGSPTFDLNVSGASSNQQLAQDVAQQRAASQSDVDSFKWYPQMKLGLYFTF